MKYKILTNSFLFLLVVGIKQTLAKDTSRIRVACLGASITQGVFIKEPLINSYPAQLQQLLGNAYDVTNYGVSGSTMLSKGDNPFVNSKAYQRALESHPHVVIIDLGGNDSKLINRIHLSELEADFRHIIHSFRSLVSDPRIILLTPVTSFVSDTTGIWDEVIRKSIIPVIQTVAYSEKVEILDMHPLLLGRRDLYLDDIHPSESGALLMAQRLAECLSSERSGHYDIFQSLNLSGHTSSFYGFECLSFRFIDHDCKVVKPKWTNKKRAWIWRARFWAHEPQVDIALLERGYHLVYCDVAELFGNKEAVRIWNKFYDILTQAGLNTKVALEGMSRGAIYVYNWAAENPTKVACIYVDNPVLNLLSWPGSQFRNNKKDQTEWQLFKKDFGIKSDTEALTFKQSPINKVSAIVSGKFPMLHVCGDADEDVLMIENTIPFIDKVKSEGGQAEIILKKGFKHHPHSLPNPAPIVDFILKAYSLL